MRGGRARTWDTKEAGLSLPRARGGDVRRSGVRSGQRSARRGRRGRWLDRGGAVDAPARLEATPFGVGVGDVLPAEQLEPLRGELSPELRPRREPRDGVGRRRGRLRHDESITIPLSAVRVARAIRLRIWNGYQKSMHLWTKNAMPNRVRITVFDPRGAQVAAPERELARQLGPQEVVVELPPGSGVGSVRLTDPQRLRGPEVRRHLRLGHPRRRRLGREAQRRGRERQARRAQAVGRDPQGDGGLLRLEAGRVPVRVHEVRRGQARGRSGAISRSGSPRERRS